MHEKKDVVSKETLNNGVVYIKDVLTPSHVEEIKKALRTKDEFFPILYIQDLKNGKNFELINSIHDLLDDNSENMGCIISGENHFSAILLMSSEHIKYRSATFDTVFVYDMDDYINKNSKSDDIYFAENLNIYFGAGNPFNSDTINAIYSEGDEFCVHSAYTFGVIDNILYMKNEDFNDESERYDFIEEIKFETKLYIERMENIREYFLHAILKLY